MKKSIMIAMATTLALASCQTDDIMDTHPGSTQNANNAIRFDGEAGKMSRANTANGQSAADKLKDNFIVYGTKTIGEATTVVYNYYNVNYKRTNSGDNNGKWEYQGETKNKLNKDNGSEITQTIKYWDYSASQYDFVAFSFGEATQGTETQTTDEGTDANANTVVAKITTEDSKKFKNLTLTGKAEELAKCYVADLVTAKPTNTTEVQTAKKYVSTEYNKPVTFNFHSMMTKVQLNIYETINGYSVKDVKFYASADDTKPTSTPTLFTGNGKKIPTAKDKVTVTVTFNDGTSEGQTDKNLAKFAWSNTQEASSITFGTLTNPARANNTIASSRADDNEYIGINETSPSTSTQIVTIPVNLSDGLYLKVDYTLVSDDGSGETITVKGANVKIDGQYTNWKDNTSYTYKFKISDKTNGNTGEASNPAGLHPITFDAVVTESEDGVTREEIIQDSSTSGTEN